MWFPLLPILQHVYTALPVCLTPRGVTLTRLISIGLQEMRGGGDVGSAEPETQAENFIKGQV